MSTKHPPHDWLESRLEDPAFAQALEREEMIETFLDEIEAAMIAEGMSRSDLARALGVRPSYVTKLFRRTANLTARSMVDLAWALGRRVRLRVTARTAALASGDGRPTAWRWTCDAIGSAADDASPWSGPDLEADQPAA